MESTNIERLYQALMVQGCAIDEELLLGESRAGRIRALIKPLNKRLINNTHIGSAIVSRTQYIPYPLAISKDIL